uniref:Ig-like domain-containing protein n=2 Tax=Oreochromis aureus TaxID=47969 RepID=A0A668VLE0_OREAU
MCFNKKMMVLFYLLLTARMGGCSNDHNFVTKTVDVGQNVTLSCIRQHTLLHQDTLFWIRLVSGNQFEFLGGTFTFDYDDVNNTSHITVKQEPGTFIMQISKTKLSDTGLYYCIKVRQLAVTFLEGTFLTIKGPEPDVIQVRSSDRIHSGDQETLQCSVLSKYEKKTCPENPSVYWFRAGSDKSHSIHVHGNSGDECERSPEAPSQRKCVYSFSRNVSSSDPGLYYCAVAICGQIIFGNESKLDIKAADMWDLQTANTALFLLCAALVTSLMVIGFLIYTIKKKSCHCCNGSDGDQQGQQTEEDLMVYTVPTFTRRKNGKVERRNGKVTEGETVYSDVSVLARN